jgi:23S rRNA pseudouridine955/2504/2580 synthase
MKKLPDFKSLIVFENEDFIVINKPPHVPTLDERTGITGYSILRMAKQYSTDAQAAHRLDKETSGVLAIAKNQQAYRHLSMQFEHREVTKVYHAVVNGNHRFEDVSVYLPIAMMNNGTSVKIDRENGKEAETLFKTIEIFRRHTLVKCFPVTGRMHQIRIHLQCLKAPIVNDPTYSGEPAYLSELKKKFNLKQETEEQPLIQRVALHAFSLTFRLLNDEEVNIEAPYPKDFAVLLLQLEKNK